MHVGKCVELIENGLVHIFGERTVQFSIALKLNCVDLLEHVGHKIQLGLIQILHFLCGLSAIIIPPRSFLKREQFAFRLRNVLHPTRDYSRPKMDQLY